MRPALGDGRDERLRCLRPQPAAPRGAPGPALGERGGGKRISLRFCEKAARADAYFAQRAEELLEDAEVLLPPALPGGGAVLRCRAAGPSGGWKGCRRPTR